MKQIFLIFTICVISVTVNADTYCLFDKATDKPLGTVSIADENLLDWEKNYTIRKPKNPEEFRGKHHWEIKYDGGKIRHATKAEKDAYKAEKKIENDAISKASVLENLGLTEEDISKIKNIQ